MFIKGQTKCKSCAVDEGGPLGAGLQEQASNNHKLLWQGSERYGKGIIICHVRNGEMNESEPLMKCRNLLNDVKTRGLSVTWYRELVYWIDGVRHKGGMNLFQAIVWNYGNLSFR